MPSVDGHCGRPYPEAILVIISVYTNDWVIVVTFQCFEAGDGDFDAKYIG